MNQTKVERRLQIDRSVELTADVLFDFLLNQRANEFLVETQHNTTYVQQTGSFDRTAHG